MLDPYILIFLVTVMGGAVSTVYGLGNNDSWK